MHIYEHAAAKLEPEASLVGKASQDVDRAIQLSIAISLKRIADSLEKDKVEGPIDPKLNINWSKDE